MSTKTVTIGKDGSLVITKNDDGDATPATPPPPGTEAAIPTVVHIGRHHNSFDGGAFTAGLFVGAILLLLFQRLRRNKLARLAAAGSDRDTHRNTTDFDALARRTATLERIVTDPARRVGEEIEALR